MNSVTITGRLTKNIELKYTNTQMAVARFTIACDRQTKEKGTDFIPIVVFGKQAENCDRYIGKGSMVGIEGRIQTGSYEKDGRKVYTTDVIANRVEFLGGRREEHVSDEQVANFDMVQEEIPF